LEGVRDADPRIFFLTIIVKFWKQIVGLLKKFLEIGTFCLKVTGPCMSRQEMKVDVWKYICPIDSMIGHIFPVMVLGAVLEKKLDN